MRWQGQTIACIASGPSLCEDDCLTVQVSGIKSIAVNSSWQMARFCDVIYAGDYDWWKENIEDIDIPAERWTCSERSADVYGLNHHRKRGAYNTGLRAVELAIEFGASRIILLGYDGTVKHGTHWHGDHKNTKNPDEDRCIKWRQQFASMNRKGAEIINCSVGSAINCFPKARIEDVL